MMLRHEFKYRIDTIQKAIINMKASSIMELDKHVKDGRYVIRSLYLDDIGDTFLKEGLSGSDPRCKYRIRYYNNDLSYISLEKKSKMRSMCLKESCRLSEEEVENIIEGRPLTITPDMNDLKIRLLSEVNMLGLRPKVIVTYTRIPYVYSGGNVRVTFDDDISSGTDFDRFLKGDYGQRPVLPCGESILEVKWDEVLPNHIKDTLKLEDLRWTAFSKYVMTRKYHL